MADEFRALVASSVESEAPRRWFLQAGFAAAAATLVPTPARADPCVPNETQVSAAQDLVDLEYSPSRAMYCRVDYEGRLWVGDVTFSYAGRSYAFMCMKSTYDYPHEIWFSNIDSANAIFRCISKSTALAHDDPEYFITDHGPIIYFNQWDPSLPRPQGGSLGLWRSDPRVS